MSNTERITAGKQTKLEVSLEVLRTDLKAGGNWESVETHRAYEAVLQELERFAEWKADDRSLGGQFSDDVASETLIVMLRHGFGRVQEGKPSSPYVLQVARNGVKQCVAKDERERRRRQKCGFEQRQRTVSELSPFDDLRLDRIRRAIPKLRNPCREIITRWGLEGQSVAEIAVSMGQTNRWVTVRLNRAKAYIRAMLGVA